MTQPDHSLRLASLQASVQAPFVLGAGSSAYQIEGAVREDGRGPGIWDSFVRTAGAVKDGSNGDWACDHYHRIDEDVTLMKWMGLDGYRFSIGWSRIFPDGTGAVNQRGLDFYDRLVDRLLENGILPYPVLYHLDLPEGLQTKGGWLNRDTASAFESYAVAVAMRLGDRVPMWFTHHEPWCQAFLGYEYGVYAPGVRDFERALQCAHHLLLSHGLATRAL
ncbi:MAG: family 1 glycosylhydrolase, partial [Deltaproteobacteria bacterium]|nr:family 1 glycosylhydrolase [Deltaproteobacteria bacterium]